ncbi:MAG TPA: hypothetical protein VG943_10555 [Caulobacterales bacterium]|nr:hypothetical protein [Caulobacterales bacterium]
MATRRHVLQVLAAAPALAACGQALPDPIAGWRDAGAGERDPRRFALAHAILAPNPHNTQPWLVDLPGDDEMVLYCDPTRRIPFTDPHDRQITLGCGAFLHLYMLALQAAGHGWTLDLFPDGAPPAPGLLDARPLARVRMAPAPDVTMSATDLFAHIAARRTNRNPYDARTPETTKLQAVTEATQWIDTPSPLLSALATNETAQVARLRDLVWRGFDREMHTRGALAETYGWLRFGRAEVARHRDGLAIEGPLIPPMRALGFFDRDDMIDPNSTANKTAADDWRRKAETAPAFAWLMSVNDAPATRLEAGMAYARMNLTATAQGLAMHPWSQVLQEYAEMADLYAETRAMLNAGNRTVQMLVRVGYAAPVAPSARRDPATLIRA